MCEYTTTSVFRLGRSVLHEEYDPIKKCNKQKRKAKLKEDDKVGN
ncbi:MULTISPECIES: hypothetical protein [unclassified Bartonella]